MKNLLTVAIWLGSEQASQPRQSASQDDNVWTHKPAWCQPWTIISTGISFVAGVRWISHESLIWTLLSAAPILLWWYVFLVLYPQEYKRLMASGDARAALSMTEAENDL